MTIALVKFVMPLNILFMQEQRQVLQKMLVNLLGFYMDFPPFLYLGAPIFIGRPKAQHFQFIVDKVRLKLAAWKASLLSVDGRM